MFQDFLLFSVQLTISISPRQFRCHDLPKRTETGRNGPKQTGTDRNGRTGTDLRKYRNGLLGVPKRTGTDQWVPKRTGTDFSSDRNELQWEPEKVGWGSIGTILIKLCRYW